MKTLLLPEEFTEIQATVIQLRSGQRKNLLKFCSVMVLLFATLSLVLGLVGSISRGRIESAIGVLSGPQKPRD